LVLDNDQAKKLAQELKSNDSADGFADLNTCNRNEWIVSSQDPAWAAELLRTSMKQRLGHEGQKWIEPYTLIGDQAAQHIFRVAIGQESLVVGERQIASQLFRALETARRRKTSSRVLNGLGSIAGRLVRIAIRRGCVAGASSGVHSLAVSYLLDSLEKNRKIKVAIVGLGAIGKRVLGLLEHQPNIEIILANRTVAADQTERIRPLSELPQVFDEVDAAIICTGANQPLIDATLLDKIDSQHRLLLIDIGIPEQVERADLKDHIQVAGLDELTSFYARNNLSQSANDTQEVELLVQKAIHELKVFSSTPVIPTILDTVQKHHRQLVDDEIPRLLKGRLSYLAENDRTRLESDLKSIILEYTNEVFRTIKDTSSKLIENGSTQPENDQCQKEQ
jgi:glutamyl-tRNA reductase